MTCRKFERLCVVIGAISLLAGCGGHRGPTTVPVTGMVKYKGNPIPKVTVMFTPDNGMLATGKTDDNGRFSLTTTKSGDGAMAGNYKVTIRFISDAIPEMQGLSDGPPKVPDSPIPAKYGDPKTSDLTRTVAQNDTNDFTFDLTD